MDCRKMEPIVYGLEEKYSSCMSMKRVNFHARSDWHELLSPIATPEFVLLDSSKEIIYRWFGYTEEQEFAAVIDPLCGS
jgi:thioredoxin-related protein